MDPTFNSHVATVKHRTEMIVFCYPELTDSEIRQCVHRFHRTFFEDVIKGKEQLWAEHYQAYQAGGKND